MSTTPKPLYTPESVDEALKLLDEAAGLPSERHDEVMMFIDWAAQKLRPVPAPQHDEAALEQLAQKYPIDLPWMQPVVAAGTISHTGPDKCSPLSCDGCGTCQEGGEAQ